MVTSIQQVSVLVTGTPALERTLDFDLSLRCRTSERRFAKKVIGLFGPAKTILLIEDDVLLAKEVRAVLRRAGHRVFTAANVSEAEEIWAMARKGIDLIICDNVLGFDCGAELVQRFRTHEPNIKVVLCSGMPYDVELPGIEFLRKPFDASTLLKTAA